MKHRLLIVDDEESIRFVLGSLFEKSGYEVVLASDGREALDKLATAPLSLVILDLNLPGMGGLEVLEAMRTDGTDVPVVVITAQNTMRNAIHAMKLGAFDYVSKPFDLDEISIIVERAIESYENKLRLEILRDTGRPASGESDSDHQIVGTSPPMMQIFKTIGRIADKDYPVLITGESGTGKELVARIIHANSLRRNAKLVAINVAAIPKDLLESELFGYEKGAFTGADERKIGRFEEAHMGTLHLDEIGEMPMELQAKLLRVLEEKRFYRLGSEDPTEVDVRIIATTNSDLEKEVSRGRFRRDLYYRLNAITIEIPPLRERKEDILPLAEYFVAKYATELREEERVLSDDAKRLLVTYHWPGNVRELENTIKRVLVLNSDVVVTADILRSTAPYLTPHTPRADSSIESAVRSAFREMLAIESNGEGNIYQALTRRFEKPLIEEALAHTRGNKKRAARLLGINRNTLSKKISELGISTDSEEGHEGKER